MFWAHLKIQQTIILLLKKLTQSANTLTQNWPVKFCRKKTVIGSDKLLEIARNRQVVVAYLCKSAHFPNSSETKECLTTIPDYNDNALISSTE